MIDRPNASQLLHAMAETLESQVVPASQGGARHAARVVANLCRILERETESENSNTEASRRDLEELLASEGSLEELIASLDERLRDLADDDREAGSGEALEVRAHAVLLADVRRRLAIDKPGYDQ